MSNSSNSDSDSAPPSPSPHTDTELSTATEQERYRAAAYRRQSGQFYHQQHYGSFYLRMGAVGECPRRVKCLYHLLPQAFITLSVCLLVQPLASGV